MKRRDLDGCPITGALQMLGNKWSMLIIRELASGPKRTMELLNGLFPISSRTLVDRLRDMENDRMIVRRDFGGNPGHIEYSLAERGMLLLPLLESLREVGIALECNQCEDRKRRVGSYCEPCPKNPVQAEPFAVPSPEVRPVEPPPRRRQDDSIVLL
jgi:DNA-binding HxlR family transcriptional regulator